MTEGQVLLTSFESPILKNNPLKDPHLRKLAIYLPPGYDEKAPKKYPVLFLLSGFSGSGFMMLNREAFSEAIDEKLNRLMSSKQIKPMIVVMPDCFTYYGGSQYLDSVALGQYETHLIQELVPYLKNNFPVEEEPASWAVAGKSSGGYGAFMLALRHPDIFGISACHSGDMGFEYCYLPDFPQAMIELEKSGGIPEFMKKFYGLKKKDGNSFLTLNIIAMAAAYSPNLDNPPHFIDLPFNLKTGELQSAIWQKWLTFDPVRIVDNHAAALQKIKLFIDCGLKDEFRLYAGSRMLAARLNQLKIPHTYEEFDDTHMRINYRYDRSLQFISDSLP
jgi:enterochelin esterase-like enzyme